MTRRAKPVLHGRDHQADGADPIPGLGGGDGVGIQFDTRPQDGDWLYIKTTGQDPAAPAVGITLLADEGIYIDAYGGQLSLFADDGTVNIATDHDEIALASGAKLYATSTDDIEFIAGIDFNFVAHRDAAFSAHRDITLTPNTSFAGGNVFLFNLPTSDPGVSGAVWNSSGTLKISP